jgi:hypothetical protein
LFSFARGREEAQKKKEAESEEVVMHTVWVRLNAVVFFGLTVLLGLSCLAALSKLGHSRRAKPGTRRAIKNAGGLFDRESP